MSGTSDFWDESGIPMLDEVREEFIDLSEVLTGVSPLDAELARAHLERLLTTPASPQLRQCLETFRGIRASAEGVVEAVQARILDDPALNPVAAQIIALWYTGALPEGSGLWRYESADQYFSGLVWSIIGAHPPGLSGGYFGHWRYPPENERAQSGGAAG